MRRDGGFESPNVDAVFGRHVFPAFQAGVRSNIIPDSAVLRLSIRTFDAAMKEGIFARIRRTAEGVAAASGATVRVTFDPGVLATFVADEGALQSWRSSPLSACPWSPTASACAPSPSC